MTQHALATGDARPLVIKIGGSTLEEQRAHPELWLALAGLAKQEHAQGRGGLVLVHGGGKAADRLLTQLGFTTQRQEGIRITPSDQMDIIAAVLAGSVNKSLVGSLLAANARPVGLCLGDGGAIATARSQRYTFDAGRVGEVLGPQANGTGDAKLLRLLLAQGYLPVLSSIGIDAEGGLLNINADDAAAGVAVVLAARALVLMTDVAGVKDEQGAIVPRLDEAAILSMIDRGTIHGGMIPKVRAALAASQAAHAPVIIVDGSRPGALAQWIAGEAVGTRIVARGVQ